jgi:hypothetical protein
MRNGLICLIFAICAFPAAAHAQLTIEMGRINCAQYLAMPPSQSDNFSAWMSGWFSYQNNRTFVDLVTHQKNIASVKEWCRSHPNESVMTGLKNAVVVD